MDVWVIVGRRPALRRAVLLAAAVLASAGLLSQAAPLVRSFAAELEPEEKVLELWRLGGATPQRLGQVVWTEQVGLIAARVSVGARYEEEISLDSSGRLLGYSRSSPELEGALDAARAFVVRRVGRTGKPVIQAPEAPAAPAMILDGAGFHQLLPLLRLLDQSAGAEEVRFTALAPSGGLVLPGRVLARGELAVSVGLEGDGPLIQARYDLVSCAATGINVFRDARGEVFRIEVPLQAIVAVRQGYEPQSLPRRVPRALRGHDRKARREEEIQFTSRDGSLRAGTLLVPAAALSPRPAVLLLTGSGSQDRNEDTPAPPGVGIHNRLFEDIAESLTSRAGVVTLRCDDIGVGGSGKPQEEVGLTTLIDDAEAAVEFLRQRPEVDPKRVFVLGHSEGAMVGPALAARGVEPPLAGLCLMAGPAESLGEVMVEQQKAIFQRSGLPDGLVKFRLQQLRLSLNRIRSGAKGPAPMMPGGMPGLPDTRWLREHLEFDPAEALGKVRCPVLVLQAEQDLQVLARHADLVRRALEAGKCPDVEVRLYPGLDHLFLENPLGDLALYADPRRRIPSPVLHDLVTWFRGQSGWRLY